MTDNEFKRALADAGAKRIKEQVAAIDELEQEIERKDKMLTTMFNRCFAQSCALCLFCNLRKDCDELRTIGKKKPKADAETDAVE